MTAFLQNTVSSMTVQTDWPMQTILPITCSVRWKSSTRMGKLERKADMFTKRTIKPHQAVAVVDTASEALAVSISEKACVDMDYMSQLTEKQKKNWPESCKASSSVYRDSWSRTERPIM